LSIVDIRVSASAFSRKSCASRIMQSRRSLRGISAQTGAARRAAATARSISSAPANGISPVVLPVAA
jgi:hypothetical protein